MSRRYKVKKKNECSLRAQFVLRIGLPDQSISLDFNPPINSSCRWLCPLCTWENWCLRQWGGFPGWYNSWHHSQLLVPNPSAVPSPDCTSESSHTCLSNRYWSPSTPIPCAWCFRTGLVLVLSWWFYGQSGFGTPDHITSVSRDPLRSLHFHCEKHHCIKPRDGSRLDRKWMCV